jgi:O-acetylhomoserine (thiol)-lyase|tara:strand:+ start:12057 stop:13340 length:1284 start_codon:yes stop_codon:yes gene_type:complete
MHKNTICLHHGYRADPATNSVAVPIYQTTSYQFDDTAHAARLFGLEELGNIYTRIMNPTCDVLEQRMAAFEGGAAALAVSSGQAASAMSVQNIAQAGDNIVVSTDIYGGTWNLFGNTLKTMGIEARFVDPADPENFRRATDDKTRAYYGETLANPKLRVFPIVAVAAIGRELGVPLIMDNTAAPTLCHPFEHGAAIIVYSMTKYIGGHGTSIGGMIIDGGTFDWEKHAARFPLLTQPDPSYHGAVWTEAAKGLGAPIAYILKARTTVLRDMGQALSPFNAWMFLQGLETLPLRMREHCRNAETVAKHLAAKPGVTKVIFPGLEDDANIKKRNEAHMSGGWGGLVGFEMAGGAAQGAKFIDALKLLYHVANIGDARSLAIHPWSTTHQQLSDEEKIAAGVTEGYVRLSVGIEHIDDIIADLDQALEAL